MLIKKSECPRKVHKGVEPIRESTGASQAAAGAEDQHATRHAQCRLEAAAVACNWSNLKTSQC
jgi:hypothetical protein